MLNEIIIKREKVIASIDKEALARRIMSTLPGLTLCFMYFGGSVCYGTFVSGKSDYDINVVVDGYSRAFKADVDGADVFIYGKDVIQDRLDSKSPMSLYKKCFVDDVLSLPDTLIYLNEGYKDVYERYRDFDLTVNLKAFLTNFYEYYAFCFTGSSHVGKKFYHVMRIRGQIENYKKTGVFSLDLPERYFREAIDYKVHWNSKAKEKEYHDRLERYLDEIYEFKEGLKDG